MGQWCYNLSCQEGNRVTANLENFIKRSLKNPLTSKSKGAIIRPSKGADDHGEAQRADLPH